MLTLEVQDIDKAVQHLRAKGAAVGDVRPDGPFPGSRTGRIEPTSTHGVHIQLIQR